MSEGARTVRPTEAAVPPGPTPARRTRTRDRASWLRSLLGRVSPWVAVPVALYLVLGLSGVTLSSIGAPGLRENPDSIAGAMLFGANAIRTDEYLTSSPAAIAVTVTGETGSLNPLVAPDQFSHTLPSGAVSGVVFFDGTLLRSGLPDQMTFALRWWLPFLLLALGAPALMRALTGSRWAGLVMAGLVVTSPASAWWSFSTIGIIGYTVAGAAALLSCAAALRQPRSWWRVAVWGAAAAVLLARTPFHYQPWAIVLAPALLAVVIVPMVADRAHRRTNLLAVGGVGVLAVLLAGGVLLEDLTSIRATMGTVYPGSRVDGGGGVPFEELFGGTALGTLRQQAVVGTNPSELSSSFTVIAVWAVVLLAGALVWRRAAHRAALVTTLVFTGAWAAWATIGLGTIGTHIPVLSMVPAGRAGDVLGYLAILLGCLTWQALPDRASLRPALLAAGGSMLVAGWAGSLLQAETLPGLTTVQVWLSSLLVAAISFTVAWRPRWWGGPVAALVCAAAMVWNVNPVLVGLGDLRGSETAARVANAGEDARAAGDAWVSDDIYVDALLVANAVPSLSGRQLAGPDKAAWEQLDPGAAHEDVWNRGGSFITFDWTDAAELTFSNPVADVILVSGSPCALAEQWPDLTAVVSAEDLSGSGCLTPDWTFSWDGAERTVYEVTPAG